MRFKNKTVLVTGSSQGLGAEMIKAFSDEGANIVINYNNNKQLALELLQQIGNNNSIAVKADVSKSAEVKDMFEKILTKFGGLDILVNNAAIYRDSTVWKMSESDWDSVIDIDLKGVFNCTKFASDIMRKNTFGRIINISSVVAQTSSFGTSNYAAAKSGILGFTKGVATELAKKNITVNSLCLGFIEIGMLLKLPEEIRANIISKIPVGRWGRIEEVTEALFFLSSKNSGYITGQTINLNGGYFMQ